MDVEGAEKVLRVVCRRLAPMRLLLSTAALVLLTGAASAAPAVSLMEFNPPAAATNSVLAIVGATLIDGRGGAPLSDAVILIRGSKIGTVGPRKTTRVPPDAELFDATGKTLLPGLMDSHFHIERDYELPPLVLSRGITSVRDPGQWIEVFEPVRASARPQPRCFVAGRSEEH